VGHHRRAGLLVPEVRGGLQQAMTRGAGVLRSRASLVETQDSLQAMLGRPSQMPGIETWEATNLHLVASTLATVAAIREETRGSHWREDFPDRDDEHWHIHLSAKVTDGHITTQREALCS
jgi:L-aspartate oxidase